MSHAMSRSSLDDQLAALQAENGRLKQRVAARDEALKDKERMDWLEADSFKAQRIVWDKHCGKFPEWSLRQAIEAAIKAGKEGE